MPNIAWFELGTSAGELGLQPAALGVVIYGRGTGQAYAIEFAGPDGATVGVETVETGDLRGPDDEPSALDV